jgi:hypothetical protein
VVGADALEFAADLENLVTRSGTVPISLEDLGNELESGDGPWTLLDEVGHDSMFRAAESDFLIAKGDRPISTQKPRYRNFARHCRMSLLG